MDRVFNRCGYRGSDVATAINRDDGSDSATEHWPGADLHQFSNTISRSSRLAQLDRMQISHLITEQSGSDNDPSNLDTVPHLDAESSTSTVDTENGAVPGNDDSDDAMQLHHTRLIRSRESFGMTPTLHGLCCSKEELIQADNDGDAGHDSHLHRRGRSFLSHHACLRCRHAHKRCVPHYGDDGDGGAKGCLRCFSHGFACEIVVEDLPLWSSVSRETMLPRLVRVRGYDGREGGMGVRFVPACRCPLRILE